jgi:hypothetical protein
MESRRVSIACGLVLLTLALLGLWRLSAKLPGMPLETVSARFPILAGESAWQQIEVPACQPMRLVFPLAQPMTTPAAISASYFVRDDVDKWSDGPVVTIRTTLFPGQSEVRLPFPDAVGAQRRLVRLKLTPESAAMAFKAATDRDHDQQYVTKRPGYLGIESLVFYAEYPGLRVWTPVACATGLQFPTLHPAVLAVAILVICVAGGWLAGLAFRLARP